MNNTNKQTNGFTLIELLVATTIFITLIGIIAAITANLASLSRNTLAILEMHRDAHVITNSMFKNYENSHITTAIHLDFSVSNKIATTFMANTHNEMDKNGSYNNTLHPSPTLSDFVWTRLEFDLLSGQANFGQTHNPDSQTDISRVRYDDLHNTSTLSTRGISEYHRTATPQREIKYFEGTGAVTTAPATWVWDDDKMIPAAGKRQMYQHCRFETLTGGNSTDPRFTLDEKAVFFIYTHAAVGNSTLLGANTYAVRNQDGMSYNKDRLNLLGSDDQTTQVNVAERKYLYESQVHPLTTKNNVECGMLRYVRADGFDPIDADTMGDLTVSMDLLGLDPHMQDAALIKSELENRPLFIECSFVLHNITNDIGDYEDLDNDPTTIYLVAAIRNQVHNIDGTPLNYVNYQAELFKRQESFVKLVEDAGFTANAFHFAKKLP